MIPLLVDGSTLWYYNLYWIFSQRVEFLDQYLILTTKRAI